MFMPMSENISGPTLRRRSPRRVCQWFWTAGSMRIGLLCATFATMAHIATAQNAPVGQPLSVIDWLDAQMSATADPERPPEPDVTQDGTVPRVSVEPLKTSAPQRIGLAPSSITGLPDNVWTTSSGARLAAQIAAMPTLRLPALQALYYKLLLAEAAPPRIAADAFDMARITALAELGALDAALALMEQTGPGKMPEQFARYMDLSLLAGTQARACKMMQARPDLAPGHAHIVFCLARDGDWNTAALVLDTARALDLIPALSADALARFLDVELFEGDPPLPLPARPDPLLFRLYDAIGTPIPARIWPLVYANADLADTAGWKAQVEAAERLAQSGALADNRLLGLYTKRQPAASGGVWDRIAALQHFETALRMRNPAAVSKTLPAAWRIMRAARLAVPFANLFARDLTALALPEDAQDAAFEVILLSDHYTRAAQIFPERARQRPDLAAVATGDIPQDVPAEPVSQAVSAAFRAAPPDTALVTLAQTGALGHALLNTLALTDAGGKGDINQLVTGLATLRALGFEDVARRAALQVLLLGRLS